MDLERISVIATRESIKQGVDNPGPIGNLIFAYSAALSFYKEIPHPFIHVPLLNRMLRPGSSGSFRRTPVTFQNGGSSVHPMMIEESLQRLWDTTFPWDNDGDHARPVGKIGEDYIYLQGEELNAFVKHFLYIHPFEDGNGRVGWILFNWLGGTLSSPVALPDFKW